MQNIERQAQKKGIELKDYGRCQFCGSNTRGGVFECFDVFNDLAMNFMEGNNMPMHIVCSIRRFMGDGTTICISLDNI